MNIFKYPRDGMTASDIEFHARWSASSGHPSGRWRVTRARYALNPYPGLEELETKDGRVVLFKTYEAAQRRADELNGGSA